MSNRLVLRPHLTQREVQTVPLRPGEAAYQQICEELTRIGQPDPARCCLPSVMRWVRIFCLTQPVTRFALLVRPHGVNVFAPRERYTDYGRWFDNCGSTMLLILRDDPEAIGYLWQEGALTQVETGKLLGLMEYDPDAVSSRPWA
jgi:hypothetical protein